MADTPVTFETLDQGVVRLRLNRPAGNAISDAMLASLQDHLSLLEADPPRALVLDGGDGKLFSGGIDVPALARADRPTVHRFFARFGDVLARLTALECPTLCAVHGHAIAGGFILPLACDLRIVQVGALKLGVTEVDLGLPVPAGAQVLLEARTSASAATRLSLFASVLGPEGAADIGYADVLSEDAREEALDLARLLASKPGRAVGATKAMSAGDLGARVRAADTAHLATLLEHWFGAPAQKALHALADKLGGAEASGSER